MALQFSIRKKLIITFSVLSFFLIIGVSFFSVTNSISILEEQTTFTFSNKVNDFSEKTDAYLKNYEFIVDLVATSELTKMILKSHTTHQLYLNRKTDGRWSQLRGMMNRFITPYKESINLFYVGSELHGDNYRNNDSTYATKYDARTRKWYQAAKANPGFNFTSYLSHDKTKIDVTISKAVYDEDGSFLGVVGIDIKTDRIFSELSTGFSNEIYLPVAVDQTGMILYHPDPTMLLKNLLDDQTFTDANFREAAKYMLENKSGITDYRTLTKEDFKLYFTQIGSSSWKIGLGVNKTIIDNPVFSMLSKILLVDAIIVVIIAFIILFIANRLVQPIEEMIRSMKNLAEEGSNNIKKLNIETTDELGTLAKWFNVYLDSIVGLQSKTVKSGNQIAGLSKQLSESITNLNAATVQQSAAVAQTTSAMEEMYQTSAKIADNANKVVEVAESAQTTAKNGVEQVNYFIRKMESIEKINQHRTHDIVELNKKVARITEIMGLIKDINEQTKLIAFNAALEASGAGEAGKRFAVVASEIRRLADTVQESMEEIRLMTEEIQSQTQILIKGADESSNIVREGVDASRSLVSSLNHIYEVTRKSTENSQQIHMATNQQKTASEQIVTTLHDISGAINNVVRMTADVSAIAEDLDDLSEVFTSFSLKTNGN